MKVLVSCNINAHKRKYNEGSLFLYYNTPKSDSKNVSKKIYSMILSYQNLEFS